MWGLSNAFKHTPKGGNVSLTIKDLPEADNTTALQLEVKDSGVGIIKEDIPRIFERFFKSGEHRTTPGSGIGLSLVKAIVEDLMGGRVSVESEVGKGSLFTVLIPRVTIGEDTQSAPNNGYTIPTEVQSQLEKQEGEVFIAKKTSNKRSEILSREDIRINDLAYTVGLEDADYFVKCFKDKFGVSPNRYAKM